MNNIEGKVVIITGASSGIGEATAEKLGNEQPEHTMVTSVVIQPNL